GVETERKYAFALAVVETRDKISAYRAAYSVENMNPAAIRSHANKIAKDPFVIRKVEELNADLAEKAKLTLAHIIEQLQEDRKLAHREGQAAAAVQADMHIAKLLGLYWDKRMVVVADDFDAMGIEQLRAYIEERAHRL